MHESVEQALFPVLSGFEGVRTQMYTDSVGLVTVGVGFMIEPPLRAVELGLGNWYRVHGQGPITPDDLAREIHDVKNHTPGYERQFALRREAMPRICIAEGRNRERFVVQVFPGFQTFPADAQLGIMCVAWLKSSRAGLNSMSNFVAACNAREWRRAGPESLWAAIRDAVGDPLQHRRVRRRQAHIRMFDNAAAVEGANHSRPGSVPIWRLWYPYQAPEPRAATGLG